MTVTIHIDGIDADDALNQMARLLAGSKPVYKVEAVIRDETHKPEAVEQPGWNNPEALSKAANEVAAEEAKAAEEAPKAKRGRKAKEAPPAPETPPEATAPPEQPADDAATAEQDAEDEDDEIAEMPDDAPKTLDDVRAAMKPYVQKFGMAAAQSDGPQLVARVMGVKHDPAKPLSISALGENQDFIRRAVDGAAEMLRVNPFKREPVSS